MFTAPIRFDPARRLLDSEVISTLALETSK
jgi:hypothetical protein